MAFPHSTGGRGARTDVTPAGRPAPEQTLQPRGFSPRSKISNILRMGRFDVPPEAHQAKMQAPLQSE
jgi:hypothetical protein